MERSSSSGESRSHLNSHSGRPGKRRVAVGLRAHSGWAALVVIESSPDGLAVMDRRRLELVEPEDVGWAKQPYHAAKELEASEAGKLVRRAIESARRIAAREVKSAVDRLRKEEHQIVGCAVIVGKPLPEWTTGQILAVHVRMHQAEGVLFPDALARAVTACKLPLVSVLQADLEERAGKIRGRSLPALVKEIAALSKSVGSPWGADQKQAALAAWIALQGKG